MEKKLSPAQLSILRSIESVSQVDSSFGPLEIVIGIAIPELFLKHSMAVSRVQEFEIRGHTSKTLKAHKRTEPCLRQMGPARLELATNGL
jgi:hypothetical protein